MDKLYDIQMTTETDFSKSTIIITGHSMPREACARMIKTLGGDTSTIKFKIIEV